MRYVHQEMDPACALEDLQSLDSRVRLRAADALGRAEGELKERAGRALVRLLLHDEDPEVRYTAALTLGELGDGRAVKPLLEAALGEGHPLPRQAAVIALGELGDERAAEPLAELLTGDCADVRFQAATSLAQVAGAGRAQGPLRRGLKDSDPEVRAACVAALGDLGRAANAGVVAELLGDPSQEVRAESAVTLARLGDRRGTAPLVEMLGHGKWQLLAAQHLYENPDPAAAEPMALRVGRWLTPALVKAYLAAGLLRLGDAQGRDPLLAYLSSSKDSVRGLAIQLLGELGAPWARAALEQLRDSPGGARWQEEIAEALEPGEIAGAPDRPGGG